MQSLSTESGVQLFEQMLLIRRFEERVSDMYMQGKIIGPLHVSIGQEAVAVGVCSNLIDGDYVTSNHRGHGHCISRGASVPRMLAELLGRSTGYCKGKGGSMHLSDLSIGLIGSTGIVGGGLPIAVGAALSISRRQQDNVSVAFFGDGAAQEGIFHEALNLAAVWHLPVLFVCENNLYAVTVPLSKQSSVADIATRAAAYGMPGFTVDGMDVLAVKAAVAEVLSTVRGVGPAVIECKTYRFAGHSRGDPGVGSYRTQEEIDEWRVKDPLDVLRRRVPIDDVVVAQLEESVGRKLDEAKAFAEGSPVPEPEEVFEDIFTGSFA